MPTRQAEFLGGPCAGVTKTIAYTVAVPQEVMCGGLGYALLGDTPGAPLLYAFRAPAEAPTRGGIRVTRAWADLMRAQFQDGPLQLQRSRRAIQRMSRLGRRGR